MAALPTEDRRKVVRIIFWRTKRVQVLIVYAHVYVYRPLNRNSMRLSLNCSDIQLRCTNFDWSFFLVSLEISPVALLVAFEFYDIGVPWLIWENIVRGLIGRLCTLSYLLVGLFDLEQFVHRYAKLKILVMIILLLIINSMNLTALKINLSLLFHVCKKRTPILLVGTA